MASESADDIAKSIINGDIVLVPGEYASFWSSITRERSTCARYMARIVILLINLEKDQAKTEKALLNHKYGTIDNFITLLLNTIQFLDIFVGFDPANEAYISAMEKYDMAKKATPIFKNKRIDDGLNGLARRRANKGKTAVKMLVDCSTLESEEEMRHSAMSDITCSSVMTIDRSDVEFNTECSLVDFPFTFTALTRMTRADVSPLIFDEVLKQLEGAGSALSSMAAMQGRTLALMFMLREFLTISPTADQAWMHRAGEVLIGLYKWPRPYGLIARDLLEFISVEKRSPGYHLRQRILAENPDMQPSVMCHQCKGTPLDAAVPYLQHIDDQYYSTTSSHVYLFLDKSQPLCCTNRYLLLSELRDRSDTIESSSSGMTAMSKHMSTTTHALSTAGQDRLLSLRREILLHILDLDFCIRDKPPPGVKNAIVDSLGLDGMDEWQVAVWYCRALAIVEKAKELPVHSTTTEKDGVNRGDESTGPSMQAMYGSIPGGLAKLYRESMLAELLHEICPNKTFAPRRSENIVPSDKRKSYNRPPSLSFPLTLEEIQSCKKDQDDVCNDPSGPARDSSAEATMADVSSATSEPAHPKPEHALQPPVVFGQQAPHLPDLTFQVYDIEVVGGGPESMAAAPSSKTIDVKSGYRELRNTYGYVHIYQDSDCIMKMISDVLTTWNELYGDPQSGSVEPSQRILVKAVLMGCNIVIHRFLCAYVVLLTDHPDLTSKIDLRLYLVPVGNNKLGTFLARSDKWYRRHIYDSFRGPLGICPQYPYDSECSVESLEDSGIQKSLPVTSLRKLLQDYVRQANNTYNVCVFEVLCWAASEEPTSPSSSSPRASGSFESDDPSTLLHSQSSPDIVIPFVMQIEIGFKAQLERFKHAPMETLHQKQPLKTSMNFTAKATPKEIVMDRDSHISPIELSISYMPCSMSGAATNRGMPNKDQTSAMSKIDSYANLSFNNFPMASSSRDDYLGGSSEGVDQQLVPNAPHVNFLVMNTQPCKGPLYDAYVARKRNQRSVDEFFKALKDPESFESPQAIGAVEVDVINTKDKFHILVDGALYGPFRRIVIRSCQVGVEASSDHGIATVPIMTHMPIGF
eukprot:CAMPEP_0185034502 /NCGR_PEP_ID=MMETSP1103-20130426/24456_1 /TAXON_ID=36769 /ORGANISM="Paraphysomonas bandaiensis, Strain Caron Lab Isolate" /LENGTH=1089 /DNA_ID=CAMNT_0027571189 /DNA_START=131 /DNA_END=3400 /DNA_ORIENTATION=+